THQRQNPDRKESFAPRRNGAGSQHRRNCARESREHRDKGPSVQSQIRQGAVNQRSAARKIARVLEQSHQEEQNDYLRKENRDRTDTSDNPVRKKSRQHSFRQKRE